MYDEDNELFWLKQQNYQLKDKLERLRETVEPYDAGDTYECPECYCEVTVAFEDKYCRSCGVQFDWGEC